MKMLGSEVLVLRSVNWIEGDADAVFRGNGDRSLIEAAALCSDGLGLWQPSSHLSAYLIPSENSDAPSQSNSETLACVQESSSENFFVSIAADANSLSTCCGEALKPSAT